MSLRLRLLSIVVTVVLLHATLVLALLVKGAREEALRSQQARGEWVAHSLTNSVANALITNDLATIRSTVGLLFSEQNFLWLAVHDERGREVAELRAASGRPSSVPIWFVDLLQLESSPRRSQIAIGGVEYGTITTLIAPQPILENAWREARIAIALSAMEIAVLATLLWLLLKLGLRPLQQVSQLVGRIGAGDFSSRLENVPLQEFRGLVSGVHDMAERIATLIEKTRSQTASEIQALRLKEFHAITDTSDATENKIQTLLTLACQHLDMSLVALGQVGDTQFIPLACHPPQLAWPGPAVDLDAPHGAYVAAHGGLYAFHSPAECAADVGAEFAAAGVRAYIGAPVFVADKLFATLNFHRHEAYPQPFHLGDLEYVRSLSGWIGLALERDQRERTLWEEKERAHVTLASIGDGVITTDTKGQVHFLNTIAEQLTGWNLEEASGKAIETVFNVVHEQTRKPIENPITLCLLGDRVVELASNAALLRRDGMEFSVEDSASPIRDCNGKTIGAVLVFRDVTESRRTVRQIEHFASHDQLTELPNRRLFETTLERVLNSARFGRKVHALCYLDLDQFKIVNDTCGHTAGDELLRQISMLLKQRLRGTDVLARLGGDEFGLIFIHVNEAQAQEAADQIRRLVHEFRFLWHDKVFQVGASIGLAMIDEHSTEITEIMSQADIACYAAKHAGRNRVHLYRPTDTESTRLTKEMNWVPRLRQAMQDNQLELWAQPVVEVQSATGGAAYHEILLRLREPNGDIILPGAFLSAAERYGLMPEIDRWVISRVFQHLVSPASAADTTRYMINLSGPSLNEPDTLPFVKECLLETGIDPARLCFEVTESAAINNLSPAIRLINELRNIGCSFSLDHFGSGVSSFTYLKELSVDFIKIDGNFVCKMVDSPLDETMVQAINQIGQVMGKKTVAGFVENDAVLRRLMDLGVDYVQGYGVGRPLPLTESLRRPIMVLPT